MGVMVSALEAELVKSFCHLWIIALMIMILFIIVLLSAGLDIKYALLFMSPLIMTFTYYGWLPLWVGAMISMLVIGFGGYMMWNDIRRD